MNKTLQPLALIVGVGLLVGLRLIVGQGFLTDTIDSLLRNDQVLLSDDDARYQALEAEVERLQTELEFKRSASLDLLGANVVNKTSASFRQMIRIDRGSQDGVEVNQPVMSAGYLIGLVIDTRDKSATVLLLGDPELNVAVTVEGADGLASAKAGGLVVSELNDNKQAQPGMAVTTSGLGGLYPPGLAVGTLGARLSDDILGEFVLSRPFKLSDLNVVQVVQL